MIDCDDYVSLSDDDNVSEVTTTKSALTRCNTGTDGIETIVIDEEGQSSTPSNTQNSTTDPLVQSITKIQQENSVFALFLYTCLDLENSDGMLRVIDRAVIKTYEICDNDFKKSPKFMRLVKKAITNLERDPDHKFFHIKNLVDSLRSNSFKKRVNFVTLATNLKGKTTPGLTSKSKHKNRSKSLNNNDSIVIDSDDEHKVVPTTSLGDNPNDVICLDDVESENSPLRNQDHVWVPQQEVPFESSQDRLVYVEPKVIPIEYDPPSNMPQANTEVLEKVKTIEMQIAFLKSQIAILEEAEVTDDTVWSPYVMCEGYKAEVVKLYKEVCSLVGEQPVKKRTVRLKVLEGHPLGPVQRLQTFINNNIGADGLAMFPDFSDVVKCVMVANLEDKLGWKKQQVMNEANALFIQCGRALQKKRQKREYRDLLALVKNANHDPADDDPELQRRLEHNRRAGIKKEMDLLERYALLQDFPQQPSSSTVRRSISDPEPSTSYHVHENEHPHGIKLAEQNQQLHYSGNQEEQDVVFISNENDHTNQTSNNRLQNFSGILYSSLQKDAQEIDNNHPLPGFEKRDQVIKPICNGNDQTNQTSKDHPLPGFEKRDQEIKPFSNGNDQTNQTPNNHPLPGIKPICNGNDQKNQISNNHQLPGFEKRDQEIKPICNVNDQTNQISNNHLLPGFEKGDQEMKPICIGNDHVNQTQNTEPNNTCNGDENGLQDARESRTSGLLEQSEPSPHSDMVLSDEDSDFEPPEIPLSLEIKDEILETYTNVSENHDIKGVKKEPIDIIKILEDLGDDYTTSVFDIEDPFLVIEISSDSSDGEMDCDESI